MAQHALTAVCALPLVEGALRLPKRCCHHDVRPKHRLNSLPLRTCCAPQEGPIHDVQWNSKGDYFVVGERMLWVYNSLKVAVTWLASNVWPMRPRRSHPASPATTRWSRFQSTCVPLLHFVLAAVAGFMPAKTTLFTDKCVAKFDLGARAAPRCAVLRCAGPSQRAAMAPARLPRPAGPPACLSTSTASSAHLLPGLTQF